MAFGWRNPITIMDDLGISAAGFAQRAGFQRMVAEVSLGNVGIILCFEASRLSRNSKDWAQLSGHLTKGCTPLRPPRCRGIRGLWAIVSGLVGGALPVCPFFGQRFHIGPDLIDLLVRQHATPGRHLCGAARYVSPVLHGFDERPESFIEHP